MTASVTASPSPFFHVESPYVIRNLRDRLNSYKAEQLKFLPGAGDWADFKYRVGFIAGVEEALKIIDDMEKREKN